MVGSHTAGRRGAPALLLLTLALSLAVAPPAEAAGRVLGKLRGAVGLKPEIGFRHSDEARVRVIKGGTYALVVRDRSATDNFHLRGRGVNRRTGIAFRGRVVWRVRLAAGRTYRYGSDRHRSELHGRFRTAPKSRAPKVFSTGLRNPRGLKFGPDGDLYVAEAGTGGTTSTSGQCDQTDPPYTSGRTARISRVDRRGVRRTLVDGLPSSVSSLSLTIGVADIAFVGGKLYGLIAGAGCSHGVADMPNGIIRVARNGSWRLVTDLSAFWKAHPTVAPDARDPQPDGFPFSMLALDGDLFLLEGNHGELDRVTTSGKVSRVLDTSASQGHTNTDALAYRRKFYVGALGVFPVVPGTQKILQVSREGTIERTITGLTSVLGLAFDRQGRLYALQTSTVAGLPVADQGNVVRVEKSGLLTTVVTGLSLPTAMTFGPDGRLYISNDGWTAPSSGARDGHIVRVDVLD